VLPQTRRHAGIVSLLGIRNVVLAINKMDLVDFAEEIFETIRCEFDEFARKLTFDSIAAIPLSARYGENVTAESERIPWYSGPALLPYLESVDVGNDVSGSPFRMPVQWVNRPNSDFRGFSGTIVGGQVKQGDAVAVAKSGRVTNVARIVTASGDLDRATAGQSVTICLGDEVDVSRGDVLVDPQARPEVADQFAAYLLWMGEEELLPHRQYLIKIGAQTVPAHVTQLKYKRDVNSLEHLAARTLHLNEVGYCNFSTAEPIVFDSYSSNRDMGAFIVIDRVTNGTVGAGMIDFGLRRATNVHWQALDVNAQARAELMHQKPCILWFTGLPSSGKSTIANLVEKKLFAQARYSYLLDGDNVRHGLNKDLGFTDADRVENIRRIAETAKLFVDAGLIVLVSFISPFRAERRLARDLVGEGKFVEIFVDTPLELCRARDPKGLYRRADAGEIKNFTGVDSLYEEPENPELVLKTESIPAEDLAESVMRYLRDAGRIR
jgi:bifunctional enzyme CysN/CysC